MTVWRQSEKYKIPRIAYINKMDKAGANFESCLKSIEKKLKTLPIGTEFFCKKLLFFLFFDV
jgi:elongation factor G